MFTRRILSLLGLFLVGNRIKTIAAADKCQPTYSESVLTISSQCETSAYYLVKSTSDVVTDYTTCSNDCIIMKCSVNDGVTPCTNAIITGFVLYNGGVLECTRGTCSKVTVGDKDYYINSGSSEPLIRCSTDTSTPDSTPTYVCNTVENVDGYYKNAKDGKLIKCEEGYCESVESPANGYYINGDTSDTSNKIIKCGSSSCSTISSNTASSDVVSTCATGKEGMLLSSSDPQNICTGGKSGTNRESFKGTKYGYYYITTGSSAATSPFGTSTSVLLRMGKGSVTVVPTLQYGFFINYNSIDKATSPIIKNYDDSGAKTVAVAKTDTIIKSSCEKALAGGFIKTTVGNSVNSFCPSSSGTAIDIEAMTEENYMVLKVQGGLPYDSTEGTTVLLKYGNGAVSIVPDPGTGYFLNSGPDANSNPIIKCVSGDCKTENPIAGLYPNAGWNKGRFPYLGCNGKTCVGIDTLKIATTCGEAGIGNIARFGGHTYFCPTLDNKSKFDVVSGTGTQYFLLNISKNKSSYFVGEKASTSDQKLLVKFEGGGVITVVNEPTGYYLNAEDNGSETDSDKIIYPVIKCWKGDCEKMLANEITSDTSCTAEMSGDIIYYTTNKDYEFCKDSTVIALTTPKNYYITIDEERYTVFTGPYELEDEEKKILVYISENAVELQDVDGYYINDVAVTISQGVNSKLIKCHGGQCRAESTAASTYYMNNGKEKTMPLIKCTTDGRDCAEDNGIANTYYINSGDKSTVIYCEEAGNCNSIVPGNGYYIISGETYKCEGDEGCEKMTGGVTCANGEGGKLKSGASTTICTGKESGEITFAAAAINKYKVVEIKYNEEFPFDITDVKEGEEKKILLKTTQTSIVYMGSPANGYYISGANALIKCNSKGCEEFSSPSLGYYLNADEDAKEHPFIYCNGSDSCTATADTNEDVVTACSSVDDIGKLLYDDSNGIGKLCINEKNGSVSITTEVTEDGSQNFNLLTVTATASGAVNNKFTESVAASSTKKVVVKPGNNAVVKMISSKTTPNTVDFCYKTSDNTKLIRDKDGASDYELISTTANEYYANGGKEGTVIYCKSGSNCSVSKPENGYYIGGPGTTANSVIECDGSKCESIVATAGVCSAKYGGNIGMDGSNIKLCYTDSDDQWYDISQNEKYYIVTVSSGHSSALIGTGKAPAGGKEILAKVGGKKALLVSSEGYYVNAGGTSKSDTLVELKSCVKDVCTIDNSDRSDSPALYLDAADSGKYIKCDGTNKCEEVTVASTSCSNPGDMIKNLNDGILICIKNNNGYVSIPLSSEVESYYIIDGITKNPVTGESIAATVKVLVKVGKGLVLNVASITDGEKFLSKELKQIITCTTDVQGCVGAAMAEGYYLLKKDTGGSKFLFECDSNGCTEEVTPESGYYYPNKGDATNTKPVIEYKNGVFTETVGTGACGAGVKAGVLAKKNNKGCYFCSTAETANSEIDFSEATEKYYVIVNDETTAFGSNGKSLIKSGNGKAQLVEDINNGYYISGSKKIIKCEGAISAVNVHGTSLSKAKDPVYGSATFSVINENDIIVGFDETGSITEVTGGTKGEGNTLTIDGDPNNGRVYTVIVDNPTRTNPTASITATKIESIAATETSGSSLSHAIANEGTATFTVNGKKVDVNFGIDGKITGVNGGSTINRFTVDDGTNYDREYIVYINHPTDSGGLSAKINSDAVSAADPVNDLEATSSNAAVAAEDGSATFTIDSKTININFDSDGKIKSLGTNQGEVTGDYKFTVTGDKNNGRVYTVTISNPTSSKSLSAKVNSAAIAAASAISNDPAKSKSAAVAATDGSATFTIDSKEITINFDKDGKITTVNNGAKNSDNTFTVTGDTNNGRVYTISISNPTNDGSLTATISADAVGQTEAISNDPAKSKNAAVAAVDGSATFTIDSKTINVNFDSDGKITTVNGGAKDGGNTFTVEGDTNNGRVYTISISNPTNDGSLTATISADAISAAEAITDIVGSVENAAVAPVDGSAEFTINGKTIDVNFNSDGEITTIGQGQGTKVGDNNIKIEGDLNGGRIYVVSIEKPTSSESVSAKINSGAIAAADAICNKEADNKIVAVEAEDGSAEFTIDSKTINVYFDKDGKITRLGDNQGKVTGDYTFTIEGDTNNGRIYTVTVSNPTDTGNVSLKINSGEIVAANGINNKAADSSTAAVAAANGSTTFTIDGKTINVNFDSDGKVKSLGSGQGTVTGDKTFTVTDDKNNGRVYTVTISNPTSSKSLSAKVNSAAIAAASAISNDPAKSKSAAVAEKDGSATFTVDSKEITINFDKDGKITTVNGGAKDSDNTFTVTGDTNNGRIYSISISNPTNDGSLSATISADAIAAADAISDLNGSGNSAAVAPVDGSASFSVNSNTINVNFDSDGKITTIDQIQGTKVSDNTFTIKGDVNEGRIYKIKIGNPTDGESLSAKISSDAMEAADAINDLPPNRSSAAVVGSNGSAIFNVNGKTVNVNFDKDGKIIKVNGSFPNTGNKITIDCGEGCSRVYRVIVNNPTSDTVSGNINSGAIESEEELSKGAEGIKSAAIAPVDGSAQFTIDGKTINVNFDSDGKIKSLGNGQGTVTGDKTFIVTGDTNNGRVYTVTISNPTDSKSVSVKINSDAIAATAAISNQAADSKSAAVAAANGSTTFTIDGKTINVNFDSDGKIKSLGTNQGEVTGDYKFTVTGDKNNGRVYTVTISNPTSSKSLSAKVNSAAIAAASAISNQAADSKSAAVAAANGSTTFTIDSKEITINFDKDGKITTVNNGAKNSDNTFTVTGDTNNGRVYTISISNPTNDGSLTATISADAIAAVPVINNDSAKSKSAAVAATDGSATFTIDSNEITINFDKDGKITTVNNGAKNSDNTFTVTGDTNNGRVYTISISNPTNDGSLTATISAEAIAAVSAINNDSAKSKSAAVAATDGSATFTIGSKEITINFDKDGKITTVNGGAKDSDNTFTVTGDTNNGRIYTISINNPTNDGSLTATISADAVGQTEAISNDTAKSKSAAVAATDGSATFTIGSKEITINFDKDGKITTVNNGAKNSDNTFTVTGDTNNGRVYTISISNPTNDGSLTATISADAIAAVPVINNDSAKSKSAAVAATDGSATFTIDSNEITINFDKDGKITTVNNGAKNSENTFTVTGDTNNGRVYTISINNPTNDGSLTATISADAITAADAVSDINGSGNSAAVEAEDGIATFTVNSQTVNVYFDKDGKITCLSHGSKFSDNTFTVEGDTNNGRVYTISISNPTDDESLTATISADAITAADAVSDINGSGNSAAVAAEDGIATFTVNGKTVNVNFDSNGKITSLGDSQGSVISDNTITIAGDTINGRIYTVTISNPTNSGSLTATISADAIAAVAAITNLAGSNNNAAVAAVDGSVNFTVNSKTVNVKFDSNGKITSLGDSQGSVISDNTITIAGDTINGRIYTVTISNPTNSGSLTATISAGAITAAVEESVSTDSITKAVLTTVGSVTFNINDISVNVKFDSLGHITQVNGGAKVEGTNNKFKVDDDIYTGREYRLDVLNPSEESVEAKYYTGVIDEVDEVNKSGSDVLKAEAPVDGSVNFHVDSHSVKVKFDYNSKISEVESGGTKINDNTITITDDTSSDRQYTVTVTNPTEDNVTAKITAGVIGSGNLCTAVDIKPGYYLNGADTKNSVISCKDNVCVAETINYKSCVDAGVGGVIKEDIYIEDTYQNTKFYYCPENNNEEKVQFGEAAEQYYYLTLTGTNLGASGTQLLLKKESYAFNIPVAGLSNGYYLDHREKSSMKLVKCANSECNIPNSNKSGIYYYLNVKPIETTKNLIKCDSNDCNIGSSEIPGYYVNGDSSKRIIKCTGTSACTEIDNDDTDYYTEGNSCGEGKLLKAGTAFCTDDTKNVNLDVVGYYLINNPDNGPFGSSEVLVKSGENAVVTVTSPGTGYYLNGANDANGANGYPVISCESGNCEKIGSSSIQVANCDDEEKAEIGVLVFDSEGGNIYVCEKAEAGGRIKLEGVEKVTYFPITLSSSNPIFGNQKDDKVLLEKSSNAIVLVEKTTYVNEGTKEGSIDPKKEYDKCNVDGNIIRYTISDKKIDEDKSKPCVKICPLESNSQCNPGYYLTQKGTKKLVVESDDGKEGDLYECTESGCTELTDASKIPIGYLVNKGNTGEDKENVPYILCMKDKNKVICKAKKITRTDCTTGTPLIGEIAEIADAETGKKSIKICLGLIDAGSDTDTGVELNEKNTVNYMVNVDTADNVFGIENVLSYMVINVNGGNAIVNKETVDNVSPKYRYTDKTYKVYAKNCTDEERETVCNADTTIYEFELSYDENDVAYYIYNDEKTWQSA
ncbi:scaffoldin [Anaeromyces robustus]|uniref:Scaffoldin n=1 Tax=Anaeromyces robustus TaxID=1754192 RepID=A0A1Y1WPH6_9FUNG|nr:scaffoldin [Anaeromyces robustus]|eukprot:ORX75449.1 scaffoldin [Anaeromyces robustus]